MRLQILRIESQIPMETGQVSVVQIEDRTLYARVVQSLASGKGLEAIEPYCVWDDRGEVVRSSKALIVVESMASLPLNDRAITSRLYARMVDSMELLPGTFEKIESSGNQLSSAIEELSLEMWGKYSFRIDWSLETYLKAFSFSPCPENDESILDNAMCFLELCADIELDIPIMLVNAKSFFDKNELERLYEKATSLGIRLVLLESWNDRRVFLKERNTIIDQDFVEC